MVSQTSLGPFLISIRGLVKKNAVLSSRSCHCVSYVWPNSVLQMQSYFKSVRSPMRSFPLTDDHRSLKQSM